MSGFLSRAFHRRLRSRANLLAGRVLPHLAPTARVLDIGSGTGHNAEALRRAGVPTCVEADVVDFHVVGDGPVVFDGKSLPFSDGAFDTCILAFVLSYAPNPALLLREAGRVAGRNVLVIQSCPRGRAGRWALAVRGWLQGPFAFWACATFGLIPYVPSPMRQRRLLASERIVTLADEAGLSLVEVVPESNRCGWIRRELFVMVPTPRTSSVADAPGRLEIMRV